MKKIAVVLSGCGFKDGTEITESISSLIAITEFGAQYQCFAPQVEFETTAHSDSPGKLSPRNTYEESARICRGNIKNLSELNESDFDALVIPGGFGAALHLSSWAKEGSQAQVEPHLEKLIKEFHQASKPIGAMCIAPTLLAKVLGSETATITIGDDKETAQEIEKTGAHHENCEVTDYITDRENKLLTTPAYMYGNALPFEVFTGIRKMIKEVIEMA